MTTSWLIAIDNSEPSLKAVDHVIQEATGRQTPPQIFLVNVQAPLSSDITRFIEGAVVKDFHLEAGEAALAAAKAKLAAAGLAFSAHILVGEAAPSIVDFAKDKGCSMVIMGARGLGSVIGLFMGSVATKVLHLSPVPVLLIK
ncbi:MAG: universal stress protein [Rhodoferax sp.]|uniref:universal stress protein n=1 Tax=Rhodoferax sp. TaxID=50421 RepID=UPI002614A474|nr:universal stress protein [Rhodoferax sp.]MDD2882268.1 universal stress protein [Rhodoferax sp.]